MRPPFALLMLSCAHVAAATIPVTTSADFVDPGDGLTSLREAIAAASPGDEIVFDFGLDGATITTASTLVIDKDLTISARSLPAGIRLDAELNHRLLDIPAGVSVTLEGCSLLNGRTTNQNGGGARVFGNLTLRGCLISGCVGGLGGGVFASGAATVDCENCTFSGNRCRTNGSAVAGNSGADFIFRHCTVYDNTGLTSGLGRGAGGYFAGAGTTTVIGHTVFGENRDGAGNLFTGLYLNGATTTSEGYNCLDQAGGAGALPTDLVNTDAMLGALEYWGGKSACHRPMPGSPLVDAGDPAIAGAPLRDMISGPRVHGGRIDIGAVERGTGTFEQWCEFHAVSAEPAADDDGDGCTQLFEYVYGTDPDDAGDKFQATAAFNGEGVFESTFRFDLDHGDAAHFIERSDDLDTWVTAASVFPANSALLGTIPLSFPDFTAGGRRFYRYRPYIGRPQ